MSCNTFFILCAVLRKQIKLDLMLV